MMNVEIPQFIFQKSLNHLSSDFTLVQTGIWYKLSTLAETFENLNLGCRRKTTYILSDVSQPPARTRYMYHNLPNCIPLTVTS